MKVTLQNTSRVVAVEGITHARVWEGVTEKGVKVFALIPRIAVHERDDAREFEAELREQEAPSAAATEAFPLRMVL